MQDFKKILEIEDPEERFRSLGYDVHHLMWDPKARTIGPEMEDNKILQDTGRRIITKDNGDGTSRYIADVSQRYALLPNEVMADIGDTVAQMVGAELHEVHENDTRMYRQYINKRDFCGPTRELKEGELLPGFTVYNSVDGSMGAGIEPYLLRVVCRNGMMIPMKTAMGALKARHTGAINRFDRDDFIEMAKHSIELAKAIAEVQKGWETIDLADPEWSDLRESLRYMPIPNRYRDKMPWLNKPTKTLLEEDIEPIPKDQNTDLWTIYNNFTEALTHSNREISPRTRADYQHSLHKALGPVLKIEA